MEINCKDSACKTMSFGSPGKNLKIKAVSLDKSIDSVPDLISNFIIYKCKFSFSRYSGQRKILQFHKPRCRALCLVKFKKN